MGGGGGGRVVGGVCVGGIGGRKNAFFGPPPHTLCSAWLCVFLMSFLPFRVKTLSVAWPKYSGAGGRHWTDVCIQRLGGEVSARGVRYTVLYK